MRPHQVTVRAHMLLLLTLTLQWITGLLRSNSLIISLSRLISRDCLCQVNQIQSLIYFVPYLHQSLPQYRCQHKLDFTLLANSPLWRRRLDGPLGCFRRRKNTFFNNKSWQKVHSQSSFAVRLLNPKKVPNFSPT